MPRVTFVKSARKDNPAVSKGESYYWWKFRNRGKQYSKTRPRPSQLCTGRKSEVMAEQESLSDSISDNNDMEEIKASAEACAERFRELGAEYEESADMMPEALQYGEQAENMREMNSMLEMAADELEAVDFDCPYEEDDYEDDEEGLAEERETWFSDVREAVEEAANNVEFLF